MTDPEFRVSRVDFNKHQEVSELLAITDLETLEVIRTFLPDVRCFPGKDDAEVTLPVHEALTLFGECGKLNGYDPRHERTYVIYDSLSHIVYGLIGDD